MTGKRDGWVVVPVIHSGQKMRRRDEQTFHRGGAVIGHQSVGKDQFWLRFQRQKLDELWENHMDVA